MSPEKTAYMVKLDKEYKKKPKDPKHRCMVQLVDLGYTDFSKNWKLVKKDKNPDISAILDKLNK